MGELGLFGGVWRVAGKATCLVGKAWTPSGMAGRSLGRGLGYLSRPE
jgi:hypothetical protein